MRCTKWRPKAKSGGPPTISAVITRRKNIDVVRTICAILDKVVAQKPGNITHFADLITFVTDRPGHDPALCH